MIPTDTPTPLTRADETRIRRERTAAKKALLYTQSVTYTAVYR
jgi:hypothetical protein